jgi:succinate dehydrogenase / fumarate reductase flavoprotein subunit
MDMEMVQYHPTTLKGSGFLMTEAARGEGAYLLNKNGERFMLQYAPTMKELASRDVVSRAEWQEIVGGRGIDGNVLLDLRHLGADVILKKLPQIHEMALDFLSIDMLKDPVPVRPGMHYIMGGVKTDAGARTPVPGLYAAGECACVSVHGGNRLGANSLLDTLVFGRHGGHNAAADAKKVTAMPSDSAGEQFLAAEQKRVQALLDRPATGEIHAKLRLELGTLMDDKVGVYRDEAGLRDALGKINDLQKRYETVAVRDRSRIFNQALTFALELGFMLDCAYATVLSAIDRKESRGAHCRTDYPQRNDAEWLKHVLVTRRDNQPPAISYLPVTITKWPPQERKY